METALPRVSPRNECVGLFSSAGQRAEGACGEESFSPDATVSMIGTSETGELCTVIVRRLVATRTTERCD